jgi:hypothetical protein
MKKITLNIPDNKYSFFLELVRNLGIEKVSTQHSLNSGELKVKQTDKTDVSSLRRKLELSDQQYNDFAQDVKNSREEWSQDI